jgi:nucleotide-binding universal stress UspA family protein
VAVRQLNRKEFSMQLKKILLPTDFSKGSDAGLAYATAMARDSGATVIVAHVEELPIAYSEGAMYYGPFNPNHDELVKMLCAITSPDPQVTFKHIMLSGSPAEAIVEAAKSEGVDLIVMGTHGRSGVARLLMGSVAEVVVRHAPCPVLTVKLPAEKLVQKS